MTVASRNNKHVYIGNGVNRVWPYTFSLPVERDLRVYLRHGDAPATLLNGGYVIDTINCNVTYPPIAANDTDTLPPLGDRTKIILLREVPYTQEMDLENQGELLAETIEAAFDRATMQIQQIDERVNRALLAPVDSNEADSAYDVLTEAVAAASASAESAATAAATAERIGNDYIRYSFGRFYVDEQANLICEYYGDSGTDAIEINEHGECVIKTGRIISE